MTNSISSFTVTVSYAGIDYDVKFTHYLVPGKNLSLPPERINPWVQAEKTHQIFSQKIAEMLNDAVPANYSVETFGLLTEGSAEGFTFANASVKHKSDRLWKELLACLNCPASFTQGKPAIEKTPVDHSMVSPSAKLNFTPNAYLALDKEKQREVRFSLFEKKYREYFKLEFKDYTDQELACRRELLSLDSEQSATTREVEILNLWCSEKLETEEKDALSVLQSKLRKERDAKIQAEYAAKQESQLKLLSPEDDL